MNTNLRSRIEERKNINVPKPVQSNSTFNFEEIENELEQELNKTRKTQSYGEEFKAIETQRLNFLEKAIVIIELKFIIQPKLHLLH